MWRLISSSNDLRDSNDNKKKSHGKKHHHGSFKGDTRYNLFKFSTRGNMHTFVLFISTRLSPKPVTQQDFNKDLIHEEEILFSLKHLRRR